MSISPISSISSFVYHLGLSTNNTELSQGLKSLLYEYGLSATGDCAVDLARLKQAMLEKQIQQQQEQKEAQQTKNEDYPWYEIMWELGLHQNDSISQDYDDIMDELDNRINNAQNQEDYNKYINMRINTQEYFDEYSQGTSTSFDNSLSTSMIGLSLLGTMNMMSVKLR